MALAPATGMHKHPQHSLDELSQAKQSIQEIYGDDVHPFVGRHNARYFRSDVPYHAISRVFQGRYLLRPCKRLNGIIAGVVGRAQKVVFPHIKLYAMVFMNNHIHLMLQGSPREISGFMGYIKREVSSRWGREPNVRWPGTMWDGEFLATALPTDRSQIVCLRYILSHGVKEGLVARPQQWPGIHSARQLLGRNKLQGEWFNGTRYGKAVDSQSRVAKPRTVRKADYYETYVVQLAVIPAWRFLTVEERQAEIQELVNGIIKKGRIDRAGKRPLGAKKAMTMSLTRRSRLPRQPWFEDRKALISWSDPRSSTTHAYLSAYWDFQRRFRNAADKLRHGIFDVVFPPGSFRPGAPQPLAT